MASFDRRKCKVLKGPEIATGRHCPKGWTLYPFPGPKLTGEALSHVTGANGLAVAGAQEGSTIERANRRIRPRAI
jgi:hypothetical protein